MYQTVDNTQRSSHSDLPWSPLAVIHQPLTAVLEAAQQLHKQGFNVTPLPTRPGERVPWRLLITNRLSERYLPLCFAGECNIGVLVGRLSGNLVAVRCVTPTAAARFSQYLQERQIPLWAVVSGHHNGQDFFLRIAEGEVENVSIAEMAASGWDDIELMGHGQVMVMPPSVDLGTGVVFEWAERGETEPPVVSVHDLQDLPLQLLINPIPVQYRGPYGTLSRRSRQFIEQGAEPNDWNPELYRAARDLAGCGFKLEAAFKLLRGTIELSRLLPGFVYDEYRRTVQKAYEQENEPSNRQEWPYALVRVFEYPWSGRAGTTDRAVCLALAHRARCDARDGLFRATKREMAELASVSEKTVVASLRRLRQANVIERRGSGTHGGSLYRFTESFLRRDDPLHNYTTILQALANGVVTAHDAAHWQALGSNATLLWGLMTAIGHPATRPELQLLTEMTASQVRTALNKLARFEIAHRTGRYWTVEPWTPELMDDVAILAGTEGTAEKRKLKHTVERAERAAKMIVKARGLPWPDRKTPVDKRPDGIRLLDYHLELKQAGRSS